MQHRSSSEQRTASTSMHEVITGILPYTVLTPSTLKAYIQAFGQFQGFADVVFDELSVKIFMGNHFFMLLHVT